MSNPTPEQLREWREELHEYGGMDGDGACNECRRWLSVLDYVEELRRERDALSQGLTYLSQAMEHGTCDAIRKRWGGSTPEEWCGTADQLSGLLDQVASLTEERDALKEDRGSYGELLLKLSAVEARVAELEEVAQLVVDGCDLPDSQYSQIELAAIAGARAALTTPEEKEKPQ